MARNRRKKGNPLLARILVATLAAHAIALPVLAHFGAFREIQRQFGPSRVVMVTMPPLEKEKPKAAEKSRKKPTTAAKKAGGAPKATAAQRSNVPQPKVVASVAAPGEGGSGGGPTVDPNGSGKAGALPPGAGAGGATKTPPPPVEKPASPPPKPEPKPEPPASKPPEPTPKPPAVEPPKPAPAPRRIVQAEAIESPPPTIPDDLRTEPLDKTLTVEADIAPDGKATNVRVVDSTGIGELDAVGLDAAKRYRFRPATVDDAPVTQHVRFRILFKVE